MDDNQKETEEGMDIDEIELSLRRFASKDNNKGLEKLLDSLFTQPIEGSDSGETEDGQA